MRDIKFIEIKFLSYKKRTARKINLNNDVVIIRGGNQSGRSSIVMSLFQTLGASMRDFSQKWRDDNIVTMLKFSMNGAVFQYLHIGKTFFVFDSSGRLYYKAFSHLSNANKLEGFWGFDLTLSNNGDVKKKLPLNFIFMPFYIAQDGGWQQPLRSFDGLSSYVSHKMALYYYTGVIDEQYFVTTNNLDAAQDRLQKVQGELEYDEEFTVYVNNMLGEKRIPTNKDDFDEEKALFLTKVDELKKSQANLISELKKLYDKKAYLDYRKEQMHDNLREIERDLKYAVKQDENLTCPMCGAHVKNDAIGLLSFIQDENQSKNAIIEFEREVGLVEAKINRIESRLDDLRTETSKLEVMLDKKKDDIRYEDVLYSEMYKYLRRLLNDRMLQARKKVAEAESVVYKLTENVKLLGSNLKKDLVDDDFQAFVIESYRKMGIRDSAYNAKNIRFGGKVNLTGSNIPKAVIAYTYAYCSLIKKYNGRIFCPIVIDEPSQNGADKDTLKIINQYLVECKPQGSQLILSVNKDEAIEVDGALYIDLVAHQNLLNSDDFQEVLMEIEDLLADNYDLTLEY